MIIRPEGVAYPNHGEQEKQRTASGPRLGLLAGLCLFVGALMEPAAMAATNAPPSITSFGALRDQARALAASDYKKEAEPAAPDFLKNLTYDQYQEIHFRPEQSPWRADKLKFDLQLFHRGYLFPDPVRIHLLENGQARDLGFSPGQFNYGNNHFPQPLGSDLGFAGLRLVYTPSTDHSEQTVEVASFLGASYFRLVGLRQRYGGAFRGLAIDTGEPAGEEFPQFKEFWIEKPGPSAELLQCFALMDSPTCAGAYRFVLKPGEDTTVEMEASLFVRKSGKKIGLAPLTSMFLFGKNRTRLIPDFRPEVHDSDGLLVQTAEGAWTWRSLVNPAKTHRIHRFAVTNLAGFGLLQRERDFHAYEDLRARYDLRPGLWVKPGNDWGAGSVELVEIPSPNEFNDNIVAYWLPREPVAPGQEIHWAGKLTALSHGPDEGSLSRAMSTRLSPAHEKTPPRFVVDFTADCLPAMGNRTNLDAKVEVSRGDIQNLVLQRNEVTGGWRTVFDLANAGGEEVEMRLFLHQGAKALSETWVYHYQAE